VVNQFANPRYPEVHYQQTGPEIWQDVNGEVDVFVAGIGSGGTLQGIGKFLIEMNPKVKIVAVEPRNCTSLLGREPGLHKIQFTINIHEGLIKRVYKPTVWMIGVGDVHKNI